MKLPFFIAARYIKSNKGSKFLSLISVITISGIALGVAVLILAISILSGFDKSISENIIKFNAHINISGHSGKNLVNHTENKKKIKEELKDKYSSFSSYISKKVIISQKNFAEGIIISGIDSSYAEMSLKNIITSGNFTLPNNSEGIIIGKKLSDKFSVNIGDKLTLLSLNNDKPPSLVNLPIIEQFEIIGIYESGMAEYDDIHAFINFSTAKVFFEFEDEVSGYNINLKNISKIDSTKKALNDMLTHPFYVKSYREINQHIFTWLELQQKPIPIVLGLIIIVAIFNIVGAILMLIIQKTEAIGVLKSMGATKKQIILLFNIQGVSLAITGILIGNFLAFILSLLQNTFKIISLPEHIYYLSSVPISISLDTYLLVSILGFLIALIVSFIPSYIASKIQPISAIKFN